MKKRKVREVLEMLKNMAISEIGIKTGDKTASHTTCLNLGFVSLPSHGDRLLILFKAKPLRLGSISRGPLVCGGIVKVPT